MSENSQDRIEYLIGCLETGKYIFGLDEKINTIIECIQNKELDMELRDRAINLLYVDDKMFAKFVKVIKNISELPVDDLKKLSNIRIILIRDEDTAPVDEIYLREQYEEIKKIADETILAGIEKPIKGDFQSEFKVFCEICSRLANHFVYAYDACEMMDEGINKGEIIENIQNVYGCLVIGECVCSGVSTTLRNMLACVGIDSKDIEGYPIEDEIGHAWNQVNIGGVWFNFDLTWMRDEIVRNNGEVRIDMLKTDSCFRDHEVYSKDRSEYIEKCELPAAYVLYKSQNNLQSIDDKDGISTEIINQMLFDISIDIPGEQIAELIKYLSDEDLVKYLNSEECKINELLPLVARINSELAKKVIRNKSINISTQRRFLTLNDMSDEEFVRECFDDDSLEFDLGYKALLLGNCDDEYIKEKINAGTFDEELGLIQGLIRSIKSIDFIEECIKNGRIELIKGDIDETLEDIGESFALSGDEKCISEWEKRREEVREIFEQHRRENESKANLEAHEENAETTLTNNSDDNHGSEEMKKKLGNLVARGAEIYQITTNDVKNTYKRILESSRTDEKNVTVPKGGEK